MQVKMVIVCNLFQIWVLHDKEEFQDIYKNYNNIWINFWVKTSILVVFFNVTEAALKFSFFQWNSNTITLWQILKGLYTTNTVQGFPNKNHIPIARLWQISNTTLSLASLLLDFNRFLIRLSHYHYYYKTSTDF